VKLCENCCKLLALIRAIRRTVSAGVLLLRERRTFTAVRPVCLAGEVARRTPVEGCGVRALVAMAIG
jgi:hypothetical protein